VLPLYIAEPSVIGADDASRLVRSVHPFLGWICCITAVSGTLGGGPNEPVSWTASSMDEEAALPDSFWQAVARFPNGTRWASFNGKRFDVPFVEARSAAHSICPTRKGLRIRTATSDTRISPGSGRSTTGSTGCATCWACPRRSHVPSPKSDVDGSGVADLVAGGRTGEVAAYCERDVVATFQCVQAVLRSSLAAKT
jgi:hypothetical protein